MVEKNVAYNRDNRTEEFADNDPLAQLARLVGQEDRPSHVASPAAQHPAERREPEFNLEDELLREFAIYDAPRYEPVALDAANDVRSSVPANEFMQRVESVFARKEPELAPVEQYAPVDAEEYLVAEHASDSAAQSNLRDDFSDDPESVAALFDVGHRQAHQQPVYEEAPAYVEPISHADVEQYAELHEQRANVEPVVSYPVNEEPTPYYAPSEASHEPNWEHMAETSGEVAIDLASELEMSVAEEVAVPVQSAPPIARRSSLDYSSLRLPLANFGAPRATPVVAQPVEPLVAQASVAQSFTQPLVAPSNHIEPALPVGQKMSAMDELIYDVAKYEISNKDVSAAAPVARMEPVVAVKPAIAPAAAMPPVASVAPRAEPPFQQPVAKAEPDFGDFDTFKDDEFELALDDIDFDLDLSEIANIDVAVAPVEQPAPVAQAPVQPKPVVTPIPAPVAAVVPRPQPVVAPPVVRHEAPRPVAPVVTAPPATLESLPFDPSQIGETEDQPETITEMEVPELPVGVFEPKPAPRRHEEDLDLDTELASLFTPVVTGGLDRNKNAAATRQPQPTQDEVDEFERALEQDFRRSMQEAAETRASGDRVASTDLSQPVRYSDEERSGARRWLVPFAAVLGVVLVGGGTYALMFGGSSSMGSNGAPVIIAADSEPTKVVPDHPGGRVVPNQDKAVYDRVAGGAPADPKQPSLISSSEQPVDVVQRTLIPEQLPLEGENDEMDAMSSTPVGETEDPRLLSAQEKAQTAENQSGSPVNVSPRKVRTMIVKPDGTLVAQEVPAPAASTAIADKVEELAAPQASRTEGAPAVIAASRVPVAPEQPAQTQAPAPAAAAPKPAQTAAPLPASRPASQPANVVATVTNQGNVRPAPPSQPAQETAAAPTASTNASSAGGYYVQVASLPSQAEAQKSYQNLSAKFGSVIGGLGVDIKAAEIAGKGTFYRVRIPAGDKNEAAALCERFRSAGGSCLVAR